MLYFFTLISEKIRDYRGKGYNPIVLDSQFNAFYAHPYFANNALFVCLGGVNAHKGLRETLQSLGVTEVMEAMDMDQFTNPQVRQAITTLRREVQSIPGIRYYQCTWNPRFKGVDDYLLDWTKRKTA